MTFFLGYWWYFFGLLMKNEDILWQHHKWKSEWMIQLLKTNKRTNEWINELTNERLETKKTNERTNERMNEWMNEWVSEWVIEWMNYRTYGLSTCCSRFSKKFPVISQKVAQMLLKKQSEVAFCNESCSKVARKDKNFFWSDAKICKLYNKSKISKHFCAILRRNQRC